MERSEKVGRNAWYTRQRKRASVIETEKKKTK
jgi:hypothetical protein